MHDYAQELESFFSSDNGVALLFTLLLLGYILSLSLAAVLFFRFSGSVWQLRSKIEEDAAAIRLRRNRGRPPKNEDLKTLRDGEREVEAYDAIIGKTRMKLLWPLVGAALASYVIAPSLLVFVLVNLNALLFHFPRAHFWIPVDPAVNFPTVTALTFVIESIGRAVTFDVFDAFQVTGHLYPSAMQVLPLTLLVWPLQVSAAAYLYFSGYEIWSLWKDVRHRTNARDDLVSLLRELARENNYPIHYEGIRASKSSPSLPRVADAPPEVFAIEPTKDLRE